MPKRGSDADSRIFFDELVSLGVSRLKATGAIRLEDRHTLIPFGGRTKLIGVAHTVFKNGGSWSYFVCPKCGRRAKRLWLVDDAPRCVKCCSPDVMPRQGDRLADAVELATKVLTDARAGGSILVIADTVAQDQVSALENAKPANGPPVTLLAMAPPARVSADAALNDAAKALDARLLEPTPDTSGVETLASRLRGSVWSDDVAGEGAQWRDEGYWLTPIVALISLAWFRRGWLIAR